MKEETPGRQDARGRKGQKGRTKRSGSFFLNLASLASWRFLRSAPAVQPCSAFGVCFFVEEGGDPGERGVPVDGDLVGRPRLDVIDVALLGRAPGEPCGSRVGILQ